jgi:hypothetical protein
MRTVKKIVHIDSADRDSVMYPRNGDFVVYLPKTYEKVVSINLKGAVFPPTYAGALNTDGGVVAWDTTSNSAVPVTIAAAGGMKAANPPYFFLELEGLNKADETAPNANRSAATNSVFAKIPVYDITSRVIYSENSDPHQVFYYQPAISKLDRIHITTRLHGMLKNQYIFWNITSTAYTEFSLTLELETLENSFDDYSSIETRIGERGDSGFFTG